MVGVELEKMAVVAFLDKEVFLIITPVVDVIICIIKQRWEAWHISLRSLRRP